MAEKEEKPKSELCYISICCAENGFTLECCYEAESTLSQRAGWVPSMPGEVKKYVAKTKGDLIKQLEKVL